MNPEELAQQILKKHGIKKPPVNVSSLARKLGVRVERVDLGDDCSGVLVRSGRGAVIGVHYAHHPRRQRFTVAHELGHFLLHSDGMYIDKTVSLLFRNPQSGSGTIAEERDANLFAAALLMPSPWVKDELKRHPFDLGDDTELTDMAHRFGVSLQAMSYRLANLGLLVPA